MELQSSIIVGSIREASGEERRVEMAILLPTCAIHGKAKCSFDKAYNFLPRPRRTCLKAKGRLFDS